MKPDSRWKTVITPHSLRGGTPSMACLVETPKCAQGGAPWGHRPAFGGRGTSEVPRIHLGQSPTLAAASVVALAAADAVFFAAVVVAFALLFGVVDVFFAV